MGNVVEQEQISSLIQIFEKLPKEVKASYKQKWKELIEKEMQDQIQIAFMGHFSAGKSSLLNKLANGTILPSSPLPTSSNIVMLAKGERLTRVHLFNGKMYESKDDLDNELISKLCKQENEIEKVFIQRPYFTIREHLILTDSPGIDSTDDDHRKRTESALHLADYIVYVTDYHHVQSELNFSFLSKLRGMNKPIIVIINQIDKHQEDEIPFSTFKTNIEASLTAIGIEKENIYYTTTKSPEHPLNEFKQLEERLNGLVDNKKHLVRKNVLEQAKILLQQMKEDLSKEKAESLHLSLDEWNQLDQLLQNSQQKLSEIEQKLKLIDEDIKQFEAAFDQELDGLLRNANLMPYDTREKAAKLIETQKKDFKVGLFFSKKKTEEAKRNALIQFYEELAKNVESQIVWHIINMAKKYYEKHHIDQPSLLQQILSFSIEFDENMLLDVIKPGAELNGQYVLQYGKDVSNAVQQLCKREAQSLRDHMIKALHKMNQTERERMKQEREQLTVKLMQMSKAIDEKEQFMNEFKQLSDILNGQGTVDNIDIERWKAEHLQKQIMEWNSLQFLISNEKQRKDKKIEKKETERKHEAAKKDQMINKLQKGIEILNETGLEHSANRLKEKLSQIENRSFQIAIFGAFSAGKSSFLNALIGEKIFPSSPTPTTAVINKLTGVKDGKKHGDVEVVFKNEQQILEEINELLAPLSLKAERFSGLREAMLQAMKRTEDEMVQRRLNTFLEGISFYEKEDQKVKWIKADELESFVAKEERSCMIQDVTIYYDCDLTRKGITLVDTPGASSFHGRHTELAFQYIKHADAIIFLTYYNHPFSKGDQQFLDQLGLVKDAFTLDKMFFIINAIDLAEHDQDAEDVRNYVEQMLLSHSIREPKLFQVSSLQALEKKKISKVRDEFPHFLKSFEHFIHHELMTVLIQAAEHEFQQAVSELSDMIKLLELDESERDQKIRELKDQLNRMQELIRTQSVDEYVITFQQETEELNYYVKQRLLHKLPELFKEAYHPGKFTNNTKGEAAILMDCFNEMIEGLNIQLQQEMNATTLRIENYLNGILQKINQNLSDMVAKQCEAVPFSNIEEVQWEEIRIQVSVFPYIQFDVSKAHKVFRNTKSFFEQNEKQKLFDILEQNLKDTIDMSVRAFEEHLARHYEALLKKEIEQLKEKMIQEGEQFIQARLKTLTAPNDVQWMKEKFNELTSLS